MIIYFLLFLSLCCNNVICNKINLYDIYEKNHESKYDLEVHYNIKELNFSTKITSLSYVYHQYNKMNKNNDNDNHTNHIDDVIYYVINLDRRSDRLKSFLSVFLETNLPTKNLYKVSAIDHYYGPLGCALSHIIVLDQFISKHNANHLVVLEDDVKFIDHSVKFGKYYNSKVIYDDIYSNYEWDFILLTPSVYLQDNLTEYLDYNENTKRYNNNIGKEFLLKLTPYHSTTSAGYITRRSYISKLEANLINSCLIMMLYLEHMPLKYLDEAALDRQWIKLANKPESRWYVLKVPIASVNYMLGSDINNFISVSNRNEIEVNQEDLSKKNEEIVIHAPITIKGLGRQLFIIWTTIAFARKYSKPYAFWDMKRKPWKSYWDTFFKNIDIVNRPLPSFYYAYRDPNDFTYKPITNFDSTFTIDGYFQSYLHFDEIYDEIYSTLVTKADNSYLTIANKLVDQLKSSAETRKCIYVHINQKMKILETTKSINLSKDYYAKAIKKFDSENFFIFFHNSQEQSDNEFVEEVEKEIKQYTNNYIFVQNIKFENYVIMLAMIQMDGAIIANSAYSWWIAYLMDNHKNKTVVLPSIWYANNVTEYHKKLNHWIII